MKITKENLIEKFKILNCIINYKNSDYTPTFFKKNLQFYEEYSYLFNIKLIFVVDDNFIYKLNSLKNFFRSCTIIENNLEYELFLESSSDVEVNENGFNIVEFSCRGRIFKPLIKKTLRNGEKITLNTFKDIRLNISKEKEESSNEINCTINNMRLKFNASTGFEINSDSGTVSNLIDWDFYEFPKTKNLEFIANLTGIESIDVSYREEL